MNETPNANKLTVCIFGCCNSGKSSLFNAVTGTNTAIVSELPGTTTDPVIKSIELLPHGPIVIIDTAGINDDGVLGNERIRKTKAMINRADFAIYVSEQGDIDTEDFEYFKAEFKRKSTPHIAVITKSDLTQYNDSDEKSIESWLKVSIYDKDSIEMLKKRISDELDKINQEKPGMLQGLLKPKSVVILVIPVDSEAPKGRIILPQSQLIRECLDNDIRCNVTTVDSLKDAIEDSKKVDLVVTDSQAFKEVAGITPQDIPLTSFSILMARQKGDLNKLVNGVDVIEKLKDGDKILIAETCTHTTGHEDIGKVKIPMLLKKTTGKALEFLFVSGRDYPEDLSGFALIVHCGGCMITRKEMSNRILEAEQSGVPVTNYGIILAYCNGILERSIKLPMNAD